MEENHGWLLIDNHLICPQLFELLSPYFKRDKSYSPMNGIDQTAYFGTSEWFDSDTMYSIYEAIIFDGDEDEDPIVCEFKRHDTPHFIDQEIAIAII